MEKIFDLHVHYSFDLSIKETVDIFQAEFAQTQTEKFCFLSLPHHADGEIVHFDPLQNIKGLFLKHVFCPNGYAFAGLSHPDDHADKQVVAEQFLKQIQTYFHSGYDGVKMLEGYPSLIKAWALPLDDVVYDAFYQFAQEKQFPILMHIANPTENWDAASAPPEAIAAGRVYDESYPTKQEITAQMFRVLEKFPRLKLILAHFGFMSDDLQQAQQFMTYPNTLFDITPGGEQLIYMQKEWNRWLPFWEKYQDRILYGTDTYAFPKDENWEIAFQRRPKFLWQFLQTKEFNTYLGVGFCGIGLEKSPRNKIYRENFVKLMGEPKGIDYTYMVEEIKRLLQTNLYSSIYAESDLQYMLEVLTKNNPMRL